MSKMIRLLTLAATIYFFSTCTSADEEGQQIMQDKTAVTELKSSDYLIFSGDSVEIPPIQVNVSLSPKAEAKLKALKQIVVVEAYFSGIPKDTTSKEYTSHSDIPIKSITKELSSERTVRFDGIKFRKSLYNKISEKSLALMINVFSAGRSSKINILDCDIYQGPVSSIRGKDITIHGRLAGE